MSDLALGPGDTVPQARADLVNLHGGVVRALMGYAQELWAGRRAHNLALTVRILPKESGICREAPRMSQCQPGKWGWVRELLQADES